MSKVKATLKIEYRGKMVNVDYEGINHDMMFMVAVAMSEHEKLYDSIKGAIRLCDYMNDEKRKATQ